MLRLLVGLIFLGLVAAVALGLREQIANLKELGYLGAFLGGLIGSATIVLPVPSLAITFTLGGTLASPLLVGLLAGLGDTLGELTGYFAGYSGRAIVEDSERYQRLTDQVRRYGPWIIFFLSLIPNPAFDLVGIAAGALRLPIGVFLLACWPGKTIKAVIIAYAGAGLLPNLSRWIAGMVQ